MPPRVLAQRPNYAGVSIMPPRVLQNPAGATGPNTAGAINIIVFSRIDLL